MADKENDPLLNKRKFQNRRNMAYISLFSMIVMTILAMFVLSPEAITAFENILIMAYTTFTSIILGYMGSTTWVANKYIEHKKEGDIDH